jgi:hypothetical protein
MVWFGGLMKWWLMCSFVPGNYTYIDEQIFGNSLNSGHVTEIRAALRKTSLFLVPFSSLFIRVMVWG